MANRHPDVRVRRRIFARSLLEIVRDADQPLTTHEVTKAMMLRFKLNPFDRDAVLRLAVRVEDALLSYAKRGLVERVLYGPMAVGWRITDQWRLP